MFATNDTQTTTNTEHDESSITINSSDETTTITDNAGNNSSNNNKSEEILQEDLPVHQLPETEQETAQVDELLTEEFNNLSVGEREKVMFDIHGIPQPGEGTNPSNIEEFLQQLESEIKKIKSKDAYDLAKVQSK